MSYDLGLPLNGEIWFIDCSYCLGRSAINLTMQACISSFRTKYTWHPQTQLPHAYNDHYYRYRLLNKFCSRLQWWQKYLGRVNLSIGLFTGLPTFWVLQATKIWEGTWEHSYLSMQWTIAVFHAWSTAWNKLCCSLQTYMCLFHVWAN